MLTYHASPVTLLRRFAHLPHVALFDSAQADGPKCRYDILSAAPRKFWTWQNGQLSGSDALDLSIVELADFLNEQQLVKDSQCQLPFNGGLIGLLRYHNELIDLDSRHQPQAPTLEVGLYDWAIITDHQQKSTTLYFHPFCPETTRAKVQQALSKSLAPEQQAFMLTQDWQAHWLPDEYNGAFSKVKEYLYSGDCYQINLTQSFSATYQGDLTTAYEKLRAAVGSPFSGYFSGIEHTILSVSPERLLRVNEQCQVEARPIKGTRPRAANAKQDQDNANELLASEKDRAENVMIVDLLRNDLGKVAKAGSVSVPTLFGLESYRNVHHMVSVVQATLSDSICALHCFFSASPGGSITGAPKRRAMEIIDELEGQPRSAYCGSLFYHSANGRLDASILIRTMEASSTTLTVNGGGGIVYDSQVDSEYEESLAKIRKLMQALQQ